MLHEDRRRAQSFGDDAERYDRARPTYPPALVDELVADSPARALDVGCGTGKVGRLLAERGCEVLGVEPDPRMAAVARRFGLAVEASTFEAWDPAGRLFDLVASGQAWHWVDPAIGAAKAADVLRPGGRLALFWNLYGHEPATRTAFADVYARFAPHVRWGSCPLGTSRDDAAALAAEDDTADAFAATGRFGPPERRVFGWEQRYERDEWLDQLPTHSDHRLLPPEQLDRLLGAIGTTIDGLGGSITVRFETHLLATRRSA